MAERRMFAKTIVDSDAFLEMPLSTQALYFHLSMRADDEGFVNNPKKIQRMIGASDDDCKILVAKRFVLTFDSGIIVIKHWKIHNYIQTDRFKPTNYVEEKSKLMLDQKKAYTECIHNVSKMYPQDSIGKDSIGKYNLSNACAHVKEDDLLLSFLKKYPKLKNDAFDLADIDLSLLDNKMQESDFLKGVTSLQWLVSNYDKVVSGKYKTFKKETKVFENQRSYSKEELDSLIDEL